MERIRDYQDQHKKNLEEGVVNTAGEFIENTVTFDEPESSNKTVDKLTVETAAKISIATEGAEAKMGGFDMSMTTVENLHDHAGEHNTNSGSVAAGTKLDLETAQTATIDAVESVLIHEGGHVINDDQKAKPGNELTATVNTGQVTIVEGVNSLSEADTSGREAVGYKPEQGKVIQLAEAAGSSKSKVVELRKKGDNAGINKLMNEGEMKLAA